MATLRTSLAPTRATSKLPIPAKDGKALGGVREPGGRRALGNITNQQPRRMLTRQLKKAVLAGTEDKVLADSSLEPELRKRLLPEGVRDIDTADLGDPHLAAEYVEGIVSYLQQRERATLVRPGHLVGCPTTKQMREILVDWLVEVQDQFKLLPETLFSTVDIVDRYLAKEGKAVVKKHLQLLGVTAMFVAAKVEEVYAPSLSDFVWITDQAYTEDEIKRMELKVIGALDFELTQPTALVFLRRFSKAAEADAVQHCLAKYALEASMLECELVSMARSELAAAALLLARLLLKPAGAAVWDEHMSHWTGYTREHLLPTARRLAVTIRRIGAAGCRVEATRKKFQGGKLHYVADRPELQGDAMAQLAGGQ